jgi:HD superfamily phosphohydrolase
LRPYIENCDVKIEDLLQIWGEKPEGIFAIIKNIVEGPLGADRMDFTQRDAYYTGTQHLGTIPTKRLIKNSKLVFIDNEIRLSYSSKCISDIIRSLDGRLNLYESVYLHRKTVEASLLVELMLEKLTENADLINLTKDPEEFVWLNDHKIYAMILETNNPEAIKIYKRLMLRKLPKTEHEIYINDFSKSFDMSHYEKLWYPDGKGVVVKTRPISGIDHKKFKEYKIFFYDKEKNNYTCENLLEKIGYTPSIKPYYIVRGIRLEN